MAIYHDTLDILVKRANFDRVKNSARFGLHQIIRLDAPAHAGKKSSGTSIHKKPSARRQPVQSVVPNVNWRICSPAPGPDIRERSALEIERLSVLQVSTALEAPTFSVEEPGLLLEQGGCAKSGAKLHPDPAEYEV